MVHSRSMQNVYARFGDLPEGGRSYNFDTDGYEAGVSVYAAEYDEDEATLTLILHEGSNGAEITMLFYDRPVYLVTGTVLEQTGGDGEPLIAGATGRRLDIHPDDIYYSNP